MKTNSLDSFVLQSLGHSKREIMAGTRLAMVTVVTIAIPISQERISPLLDAAACLLLVTRQRGKEAARRRFVLNPLSPVELARSVAEMRVDVLLCAALSEELRRELERRGVQVKPHLCGDIEAVLQAFCDDRLNRLEFRMPGCWKQDSPTGCCRRRSMTRNGKSSGKEKQTGNLSKAPRKNHRGNP